MYGDQDHTPCSGTTDDGTESPCEHWCHQKGVKDEQQTKGQQAEGRPGNEDGNQDKSS
jgi:hypothetical protein